MEMAMFCRQMILTKYCKEKILQNAGKVSYALAEQKAKEEYQKYKQLQSMELTPVEEAFVASIEMSKVDELSEGVKKLKK